MTATDYLVSALQWMPLIAALSFFVVLAGMAAWAWRGDRSHEEMRELSPGYRRITSYLDVLFSTWVVVGFATAAILFGNPYDLRTATGLWSATVTAFFLWLTKFKMFSQLRTVPAFFFVTGLPILVVYAFLTGRANAYYDLTIPQTDFELTLSGDLGEARVSVLRLLSEGALVKIASSKSVAFYRWEAIKNLSHETALPDPRSLVCRMTGFGCPIVQTSSSPMTEPQFPTQEEKSGPG